MKRIGRISLVCLAAVALLSAGALEAQTVRKIYQSSGQAEFPHIITMKNGNLLCVFGDGTNFNADTRLLYMIYNQATDSWSNPVQAVPRRNSSAYPQLAMDNNGDIHMAYMDGNSSANREIYYAMYSDAQKKWGTSYAAYISDGVNSSWPRIQVEDGIIYIAWSHNYSSPGLDMDICMVVNNKGGAWPVERQDRKTISNSGPSVSVHTDFAFKNGKAYAIWMDTLGPDDRVRDGNWKMRYNEASKNVALNDWVFPASEYLSTTADNEYYPAIAVDPTGTVHIMYSHKSGPFLYSRKNPGGAWSSPRALSTNLTNQNVFSYLRYHDGLLHALWRESGANGERIVYGRGLPDGDWAAPLIVGSGLREAGYPWMTVDNKGDVHIVWSDGSDDARRDIFYTKVELPGQAPQAVIEVDRSRGLIPLTIRFDGTKSKDADGRILKYLWDFRDGTTAEGPIATKTFNAKGTYNVQLKVLDNDFRVGIAEVEIYASTGEPFAVIKPSTTRGVVPIQVVFDGSESNDEDGQVVSWDWNFGDGNTANGPIVTHTYTQGGMYQARLTVTDNDGKTNTESVAMSIYQKPTAAFTATPDRGVVPLDVVFDASGSVDPDGQLVSYQWSFGDGLYGEGVNVTHTYTGNGPFTAQLTVVDNDGYVDIATQTIDALSKPLAPTNVAVRTDVIKTLLYRDYFNKVSWKDNPRNAGLINVVQYRVYRRLTGEAGGTFVKVGEVSSSQTYFDDRKHASAQDAARYEYAVTAVDGNGGESPLSAVVSAGGNF